VDNIIIVIIVNGFFGFFLTPLYIGVRHRTGQYLCDLANDTAARNRPDRLEGQTKKSTFWNSKTHSINGNGGCC
jgi:hypothetical protein